MSTGPFLETYATSGFSFLITLLAILGALQAAYYVVSGGLRGTRFYYQARIHDANPAVRASVIRAVANRGDAMALEFLLEAIADAEPSNRLSAIEGLRRFSEPSVQEALIVAAHDTNPVVRKAAVGALGRFQSPQAVDTLIKGLTDSYPPVQIAAIQGLKVAQEPRTIAPIARTLTSQDKDVVRTAQEALIPFGIPVIDQLGAMLPEVGAAAQAYIRVMTQLDRELAFHAIARALPHMRHMQAIGDCLLMLVRGQYVGIIPLLTELLDEPEYPSHELVINSLVRIGEPEAIVPLCRHLRNPVLRKEVVDALEQLAPMFGRELLVPLGEAIQDRERSVRKAAAHLLGRVGGTLMVDAGLLMLWGENATYHRSFLERHLGHPLSRLITYPEAALAMDKLMTTTAGEEGMRAIDELESLMVLIYGDCLRGVLVNESTQLILKDRRTLYPLRVDRLHPLAADLLDFASNLAEGDRFRLTTS